MQHVLCLKGRCTLRIPENQAADWKPTSSAITNLDFGDTQPTWNHWMLHLKSKHHQPAQHRAEKQKSLLSAITESLQSYPLYADVLSTLPGTAACSNHRK